LGLNPTFSGKIFWRTRFVSTAGATFNGPEQSFTANGQSAQTRVLTVTKNGTGSGVVSSDPLGLDCGASCSTSFTADTQVTLQAVATPGPRSPGGRGACPGAGPCPVTLSAAAAATATFDMLAPPTIGTLEVSADGLPAGNSATITVT